MSGEPISAAAEPTPWRGIRPTARQRLAALAKGRDMLGIIAVVLVVLWLLGFFAFHVTSSFIHIVLLIALVLVVLHFVQGRRRL